MAPSFREQPFCFCVGSSSLSFLFYFHHTFLSASLLFPPHCREQTVSPINLLFSSSPPSVLEITKVVCLLVGCLMSQQQASVSQGWICSDNFTCCHTEIEVVDQTFYLTQSQYTDTRPTSPSADLITPGTWQGSHWSANFSVTGMTTQKNPVASGIRTPGLPLWRWTP